MRRYSVIVSGRVQEVGFRFFVCQTALMMNLTGWVRNNYDGTVELEVQGDENALSSFLEKVKKGNRFSRVENVVSSSIEVMENEKSFRYK